METLAAIAAMRIVPQMRGLTSRTIGGYCGVATNSTSVKPHASIASAIVRAISTRSSRVPVDAGGGDRGAAASTAAAGRVEYHLSRPAGELSWRQLRGR